MNPGNRFESPTLFNLGRASFVCTGIFRQNIAMISKDSRWAVSLRSVLIGFGFFFLGSLTDLWLERHVRNLYLAIADDALVGIAVALLVLFYERRQRRNMIRKLEVIRLMNHHVRNSLQVISFAALASQQEKATGELRDAVDRIEWALREVLPGQREDIGDLEFHIHSKGGKEPH